MKNNSERKVIFRREDENRIVIEKGNFRDSLFQEQYLEALGSFIDVCHAIDMSNVEGSNIISFCGDRGDGKSSCMHTVRRILSENDVFSIQETDDKTELEDRFLQYKQLLKKYPIHPLEVIDPSFFDESHNILELVIGQLFQDAFGNDTSEDNIGNINNDRYELIKCFHRVKESMSLLDKEPKEILDNIEALDNLAIGLKLQKNIEKLFEEFLEYKNRRSSTKLTKILLCIDDLDLNVQGGYVMLEQLRKYLSNKHCVVLIALKIEQMTKVVQTALYLNGGKNSQIISIDMCRGMAEKYITKMFPTEHRVQMPKVDDIVDYQLELKHNFEEKETRNENNGELWTTVKEAVVSLIFQKTRYLFYNKEHEVNLIIPRNLRSLRHLVAMLLKMDDFEKGSSMSRENQIVFKQYFYNDWTSILPESQQRLVREIINYSDVSTKNHFILTSLIKQFQGNTKQEYNWITANVRSYNISAGDVLYVIQSLQETGHAELRYLLFFLQAYYSICLYEFYDELVGEVNGAEKYEALYDYKKYRWDGKNIVVNKQPKDSHVEIYATDERFRGISKLQQFIGGAYFMYSPGDLLPRESVRIEDVIQNRNGFQPKVSTELFARDIRNLDAKSIFGYMRQYVKELSDKKVLLKTNDPKLLQFQLCEFFALTAKMTQTAEEAENDSFRARAYPYYLSSFKQGNTILVFDVLSIFANIVDLKFAYNRFNEAIWGNNSASSFYDEAVKQPNSLLNKILRSYNNKANAEKYKEPLKSAYAVGRFASASIIRNIDVHSALLFQVRADREIISKNTKKSTSEDSVNIWRLYDFYTAISNVQMKLYGGADADNEKLYSVQFGALLTPILGLLSDVQKQIQNDFDILFAPYEKAQATKRVRDYMKSEMLKQALKKQAMQRNYPQVISNVATPYLQKVYDEIMEFDWTSPLKGDYIKNNLSDATREAIPSLVRQYITSKQSYNSADEFVEYIISLIRKHLVGK